MEKNQGEDDDAVDAWECHEEGGESEDEEVSDPTVECDEVPADKPEPSPTVESKQDPMESSKITDSVVSIVPHADTEPKDLTTSICNTMIVDRLVKEGIGINIPILHYP